MPTLSILAYLAVVCLPFIAFAYVGHATDGLTPPASLTLDLTLLGFPILILQPVLAARLKFLDRIFGLDVIYLFHQVMGMLAGLVLVSGFTLMLMANARHPALFTMPGLLFMGAAIFAAITLIVTSLLREGLHIHFERWRRLHNVLALSTLGLSFGGGLSLAIAFGSLVMAILWLALLVVGASAYVFHKILGPHFRRQHLFEITDVKQETHNVWTLELTPPPGVSRFNFLPGQFQFLTFFGDHGIAVEEHPFTISSNPAQKGFHASSIKESGDFTANIGKAKPGDKVAVQAPFGRFSYALYPDEKDLVLIAGGIGITPFISMLRHMRDVGSDISVLLLYANRIERDIAFKSELDEIASGTAPRLKIIHVLSRADESWRGEKGHIDQALLTRYLEGKAGDKSFYVCGPPPMMTKIIATLIGLGAVSKRVRSERFAL